MTYPNLNYEIDLWKKGYLVLGVDEVGRGAFAGPLFAAGIVFNPKSNLKKLLSYGINDSKKLTAARRELLDKIIRHEALAYHISQISVAEINEIGVGEANKKALRDAVSNIQKSLPNNQLYVLVDGFEIENLSCDQKAIIKGDAISLSIAAASIIAKVARDKHMRDLSSQYSEFGWDQNKGYGTLFHRQALQRFGPTDLHRTDFVENFI